MSVSRNFVLAAGGTGGHIIPAYALGAELMRRGHQVALITDESGREDSRLPRGHRNAHHARRPRSRWAARMAGGGT
jgi:UDP-N-acetylglucosamine:LPS N-acetylglucosamine transferase